MKTTGITYGPLGGDCVHLCVDMQRLFSPGYPWGIPWQQKVLPAIEALAARRPERTVFTRFIPVERPDEGRGTWARYYHRWADVTLERIGADAIRLVPELERFVPPAQTLDKAVYSPWTEGRLDAVLRGSETTTIIVTGGETDVCVLAAVLGAIDRGLRVVLVADALCSSSDQTHDALMELYLNRFSEQMETSTTDEVLKHWR